MRYLLTTTFAAVIGLLMVQPAQAASPAGNSFYGSAFVGAVFSTNNTGLGPSNVGIDVDDPASHANRGYHIEVEHDAGYHIGGALGGWIGPNYRSEIAVGWRAYDVEGRIRPDGVTPTQALEGYNMAAGTTGFAGSAIDEVTAIDVVWNNYFHVLEGAHQPYAGFGIGVGFWSVDGPHISDAFKTSILLNAMLGYDFYLSGLPGDIKDTMGGGILDDVAVGVEYRFSWADPKLSGVGGNRTVLANSVLQQTSHEVLFNVRYEF